MTNRTILVTCVLVNVIILVSAARSSARNRTTESTTIFTPTKVSRARRTTTPSTTLQKTSAPIPVTKSITNSNRAAKRNSNPVSTNSTLPLKIHLNQNSISTTELKATKPTKKPVVKDELMCPEEKQAPFQLFPQYCSKHKECRRVHPDQRCCKLFGSKRCVEGMAKPLEEQKHEPIFGVIPRKCPKEPLTESFWPVQTCQTDQDCWPRVCCPDGRKYFCKSAEAQFENATLPVARQLAYPVGTLSQYLQCTPAPPPVFDSHPKACNSTIECFPNLCCQEAGKRHCRPPKRSLLALVTGFVQPLNGLGFVRNFTANLVIK